MNKYWNILKKYKLGLILCPIIILVATTCEAIQPMLMAKIIDDGVIPKNLSVIYSTGIYMVIISIVSLIASIINIFISSRVAIGFGTDLGTVLFNKVQKLSFTDIDKFSSGSLITRLTSDITRIQQLILMCLRLLLRSPLMLIMSVFFVIKINKQLALILIVAIPILAISLYFILKKGIPFFMKVQQKIDRLNEFIRENLINIRVIKSFVREDFESQNFEKRSSDLKDTVIKASNIIVSIFPIMQLVLNFSIVAILWLGGIKVMNGEIMVGELISFINYLTQVLMSLMLISVVSMSFARASASSKRIVEVLDTTPSLTDTEIGLENKYRVKNGDVSFKHVCFKHEGGLEYVLKDINFTVRSGESVAIVGATGSAKSTLVQLIPRLYDVTQGEVLIDNVDVKNYNIEELHSSIGMVLQKNELFTGTILENLKWGKPDATIEEIEEATKIAQAHDFITAFPEGYNTILGRGGVNVSGGQKQRICIARALLRKPKILIMDDSTSAVDTETEIKIREGLVNFLKDTTVFIITQRINTMQSANRVIVLEDGQIESMGEPHELMKTSKVYREIYNSQQILFD